MAALLTLVAGGAERAEGGRPIVGVGADQKALAKGDVLDAAEGALEAAQVGERPEQSGGSRFIPGWVARQQARRQAADGFTDEPAHSVT